MDDEATKEAQTSVDVYGDQVVIITRDSDDEALEVIVCHDRISATDTLEEMLVETDPTGLAELNRELMEQNSVPWIREGKQNFPLPKTLLSRFNELLAFGKAVCEAADRDDAGAVLEDLLGGKGIFYGYITTEKPTADTVALVLFIGLRGETTGVVVQGQQGAIEVLDELTGLIGQTAHRELRRRLEDFLPENGLPNYRFNQVTSAILLVGRATEEHVKARARAKNVLQ
jgi:hypothetical protein